MANLDFDFDLENAEIELERAVNLLGVFREFFDNEIPDKNDSDPLGAVVFTTRIREYHSLVETAHDKIGAIRSAMETAIKDYFDKVRKEAAV